MPEYMPLWALIAVSVFVALAIGGAMAIVTRIGLHLAERRHLSRLSALTIPVLSILIIGFLAMIPIETHAVLLEVGSAHVDQPRVPGSFWLTLVAALVAPGVVAYAVGRLSQEERLPPNKSLERTRGR